MSFPKGISGEYTGHNYGYVPHQMPRSYHRQPGSPEDGDPAGHATHATSSSSDVNFGTTHSPLSVPEDDFDFGLLNSRNDHMSVEQSYLHAGTSNNLYLGGGSNSRLPDPSGTMSLPSEVAAMHGFSPSYPSLYGHSLSANSHYSAGLTHMQSLGNALGGMELPHSLMYAPSPAGSDSSLEESSGSAYSSQSQSPSALGPTPISMALPTNQETEEYLRRTLEIPAHLPIDLRALPEPTEKKQPPITHMIKLAIWGSKHKRLTLRQIYDEVERRYPSLKDLQDKPWQRSIRHNLSLKAIFVRVERPTSDPGKGHYWAVDIRQGEGNKRDRKRKDTSGRASTSRSEDDEEFSEGPEDDRSSFVMLGGRHGDRRGHQALRIPQESQYTGGPSMYQQNSSLMVQQSSHGRIAPYPQPMLQGLSQVQPYPAMPMNIPMPTGMMPRNDVMNSMGMQGFSLPSNIEHRHGHVRRQNSDTMPNRSIHTPPPMPFIHPHMTLPPLDPSLTVQPDPAFLSLNPNLLHSVSSRRPDTDDDDSSAKGSRRHRAQ